MSTPKLLERLYSLEHLAFAWKNIDKANPESFGLSGESIAEFGENIETNLQNLSHQIKSGTFQFFKTRPYLIAKDNGKFRPLQIPEVRDRIVLKGIAIILEEQLQKNLVSSEGISFAYQKGKGIQNALSRVKEHYDNGNHIIYEADIIDFFGTVSRDKIIKQVCDQLSDPSLNDFIKSGITPKVGSLESIPFDQQYLFIDKGGIPQGNALSPLFSNIYLSPFDAEMKRIGYHLVRYADDFVILAPSKEVAIQAYEDSRTYLKDQLALDIHELSEAQTSKTRIVDPKKDLFSFLSVSFDGINLFPSIKNKDRFIDKILSLCNSTKDRNIIKVLNKVKNSHDGWISTFLFTDVERYFEEIDWIINWGIYIYLKSCEWKFKRTSLAKMPQRFRQRCNIRYESGECLSQQQRKNSGIPLSKEIYLLRMQKVQRDKISHKVPENQPKALAI